MVDTGGGISDATAGVDTSNGANSFSERGSDTNDDGTYGAWFDDGFQAVGPKSDISVDKRHGGAPQLCYLTRSARWTEE